MPGRQLIFVYNGGSTLYNLLTDFAHKIISPLTYQCHLCTLTYGNFSIKQEWKSFIKNLPVESVFLHKDEFSKQHNINDELPAAFIKENEIVKKFLTKEEIENCRLLQQLENMILNKLSIYDQHNYSNL